MKVVIHGVRTAIEHNGVTQMARNATVQKAASKESLNRRGGSL